MTGNCSRRRHEPGPPYPREVTARRRKVATMTDDETWTAERCAQEWGGIRPSTWRDYVAKGYAPKPLPGFDEQRRRRWRPAEVIAAKAARAGQGVRPEYRKASPSPTP